MGYNDARTVFRFELKNLQYPFLPLFLIAFFESSQIIIGIRSMGDICKCKIIFLLFPTHSVTNSRRLQGSWRKQRWPASSHTNFPMETNKVCKDASPPYELAQWVENLFKGAFTFLCTGVFHKVPLRWPKVTILQASQSWHQLSD